MDSPQDLLQQALTLPNGSHLKNRLAKSAMSEALGSLPNRQLRNNRQAVAGVRKSSLPNRQLRKLGMSSKRLLPCSLPNRQLRNFWVSVFRD